ncbi:MAG: ATP-binding protein, partial [Ruminococcus sp.]|nr:ATP-binding protein [Ruminococcus sp.]
MGVINVLDKHVAELIAAGEVVERPASVIKELIENAIDAGAKHITVEIQNGGTTFMRVTDDGCGFLREDVKLAFLRHATSKVRQEDDLGHIATLGFRGEALASISAVSRLQLITRNAEDDNGVSYRIEGGEEVSFEDAGCPVGTTFVIRDLFYNIPARAKFLKKDVSEGNQVSNIVDKVALSHPEIAFTFIRDSKQTLKTFGDGKLMSAIYAVFGREFAQGLIPVDYALDAIRVTGYIS